MFLTDIIRPAKYTGKKVLSCLGHALFSLSLSCILIDPSERKQDHNQVPEYKEKT